MRLFDAVVRAVAESYRAKTSYDAAKQKRALGLTTLAVILTQAREAERAAEKALAAHMTEHGCGDAKTLSTQI